MRSPLRIFATLLLLGFSSGVPFMLTSDMMQAWMTDAGLSKTRIGLFSLVWIPLAFKFLWAPLMDAHTPLPLGRRRGWLLIAQLALVLGITLLAWIGPTRSLVAFAGIALFVTFASASQDIVGDAYRTDITPAEYRGAAASIWTTAYRVAMLATASASMIFVGKGWITWRQAYLIAAGYMAVGIVGTLIGSEPVVDQPAPPSMISATAEAVRDMLGRPRIALMLLLVFSFTIPEAITKAMGIPFLRQYARMEEIGALRNGLGLLAMIFGAFIGATVLWAISLRNMLRLCLLLQAASNLTFLMLIRGSHSHLQLAGVITLEYLCLGFVSTGFTALLMGECNRRYSAFQYALLSGIMRLATVAAATPSGWLADRLGWHLFFVLSIVLVAPPIFLLTWIRPSEPPEPQPARQHDLTAFTNPLNASRAVALQPMASRADNPRISPGCILHGDVNPE